MKKIIDNLDEIFDDLRQQLHNMVDGKTGNLCIKTDGTSLGTTCHLNGVLMNMITKIEITPITPACFVEAKITVIMPNVVINGQFKTKELHALFA